MKRYIVLTALCLVLAVVILVGWNTAINRTEDQVKQIITISRGDPSAAQGITVKTALIRDRNLLWETTRDVASDESKTSFSLYSEPRVSYSYEEERFDNLYFRVCNSERDDDPICHELEKLDKGDDVYHDITLQDYYDTYPLYLGNFFYNSEQYLTTESELTGTAEAFTPLQIPVEPTDKVEMYFHQQGTGAFSRYVSANYALLAHRYTPFSQKCDDGILVTVGFAPDAQPKAEWAPDGFGIWKIPGENVHFKNDMGFDLVKYKIHMNGVQVVYPLDIDKQSVLAFQWSGDEKSLLLVTAENGEAVLRVLDGTTYQVQSTVSLGTIDTTLEKYECSLDSGTRTVSETNYENVQIHSEPDFTAIAVGAHLAVLIPSESGYQKDFSCDMMTVCDAFDKEKRVYYWMDDTAAVEKYSEYANLYSPMRVNYFGTFDRFPMAYQNHKLAIAWNEEDLSTHLHVYGPEGVLYAERTESPLPQQQDAMEYDHCFYQAEKLPKLEWVS